MKLKVLVITTLVTTIELVASPSFAQTDLNLQLKQALCAQNWSRAIQVLDRMKVAAPESSSELAQYRNQIAAFQRNRTKLSDWPTDCSSLTTANQNPSPTTTGIPRNNSGNTTQSSLSATDKAFINDFKRLATAQKKLEVKDLLLTIVNTNPNSAINDAKRVCDGYKAGRSWEQMKEENNRGTIKALGNTTFVKDFIAVYPPIIKQLSPKHYCPQFSRR